jgi:hypothetical protein
MRKKILIEVNHDSPIIFDEFGVELDIDDLEKELGIKDMILEEFGTYFFPVWIDTDDYE